MATRPMGRVPPRSLLQANAPLLEGRVVAIAADGVASVDFDHNVAGPLPARSVVQIDSGVWASATARGVPLRVLLAFEGIDTSRPIIMGLVHDALLAAPSALPAVAIVDGRRVELAARDEIVLRCGRASIMLKADGTIRIAGGEVRSSASGRNRITGSTVSIN